MVAPQILSCESEESVENFFESSTFISPKYSNDLPINKIEPPLICFNNPCMGFKFPEFREHLFENIIFMFDVRFESILHLIHISLIYSIFVL